MRGAIGPDALRKARASVERTRARRPPNHPMTATCEYCGQRGQVREIWAATARGWRVRLCCQACERGHARG